MTARSSQLPPLRLTTAEPAGQPELIPGRRQPATRLTAADARWILAVRVASSLQGGRAAILSPSLRRKFIAWATAAGLREFDANLIIAIVQDAARTTGVPLSRDVADRVSFVRGPERKPASLMLRMLTATLVAGVAFLFLVQWITGT